MILDLVRKRCCDRQSRMTINPLCRPLTVFPARVNRNLFEFSITNNHARRSQSISKEDKGDAQPFDAVKKLTQAPGASTVLWKISGSSKIGSSTKNTPATPLKIIDNIKPLSLVVVKSVTRRSGTSSERCVLLFRHRVIRQLDRRVSCFLVV